MRKSGAQRAWPQLGWDLIFVGVFVVALALSLGVDPFAVGAVFIPLFAIEGA